MRSPWLTTLFTATKAKKAMLSAWKRGSEQI